MLDGTDVVMLSGETANGKFPEAAVMTMRRICEQAEAVIDYEAWCSCWRASLAARSLRELCLEEALYLRMRLAVLETEHAMCPVLDLHLKLVQIRQFWFSGVWHWTSCSRGLDGCLHVLLG